MKIYFEALIQILKITFSVLLLLILPLVVFTLVTSKTPVFGIQSFVVLTGSMSPTIPVGSIVFTKEQPSYHKNDVIAFKLGDINVTHRVVGLKKQDGQIVYQTKGDANNAIDSNLVSQKDILGKSMVRAFYIGKLVMFLKTLPGFLALIVFPALILIGVEGWNIKQELEREIRKKILRQFNSQQLSSRS